MQDSMNDRERRQRPLEYSARANTVDIGQRHNTLRDSKFGGVRASISFRLPFRGISIMRNWYHTGRGQKMKEKIQQWAAANALTLVFISVLFAITWIWIFVANVFLGSGLSGR